MPQWLTPPQVLALPSRYGPEGPPRPYGFEPPAGPPAPRTGGRLARSQSARLLEGPFPQAGLVRGVSEGALLLGASAPERALAMTLIAHSHAGVVRIPVDWRSIAPPAPSAGFDARDPADPAYRFEALDGAVLAAAAAGLEPLLSVSHAPSFAEAPDRWTLAYPGSWDPSPAALEAFAAALARRYGGSFPDPADPARALPRVRLLQAWNEPNLARYLEPQWTTDGTRWIAFSPLMYRALLNAFYAGVKRVVPSDTVVAAGLAPDGDPAGVGRIAPVTFLRMLLCLGERSSQRPLPRAACPAPAHLDVLAYHPLSVGDPDDAASSALDVAVSDAAKLQAVLAAAERFHTVLPRGPKPVWVTEINWEGAPARGAPGAGAVQRPAEVPPSRQSAWVSRALHRLWVGGVTLVDWQFLMDPWPALRAATPSGQALEYHRPAGLYAAAPGGSLQDAVAKPFLTGFALPFDPLRIDARTVRVWALGAPSDGLANERAQLQGQVSHGRWRTLASLSFGRDGVLNEVVHLRGAISLRMRLRGSVSGARRVGARRFSQAGRRARARRSRR